MLITKTEAKPKLPAVTYSRLKAFEVCPRRFYETEILKKWPEGPSEHLQWGDAVHKAMASSLLTGAELPLTMRGYGKWIARLQRTPGTLLVEDQAKWSITKEFEPCGWFAPHTWMRCIADAVKIDEEHPGAAYCVDWKTGKSTNVDEVQLIVIALVLFIHFPKVLRVRADFIYLQDDATATVVMDRHEAADYWALLMPRIERLQAALDSGVFPPKPNSFCGRYCPVLSCEHNGRSQRERR